MISILSFAIVIAICVVVHEMGHFLTARAVGVHVHEFSFGFGPVLVSRIRKGTKWSLRAAPLGGFVRLAGLEEEGEETVPAGGAFMEKSAWKRFLILFNGPLANMLLAVFLTALFLAGHGTLDMQSTRIGEIMPGFPAEKGGMLVGDEIRNINGIAVTSWREMSETIRNQAVSGPVTFGFVRSGETRTITVGIPRDEESGVPVFGIRPSMKRYAPHEAFVSAFGYTVSMSVEMIRNIVGWITRKIDVDVTGPVGIATMAGDAARRGWWTFVSFLALISLNLGLLNLFPFPALDGGRLVFIMGEMMTGKRVPEKTEGFIHYVGFVVLIGLILLITWNDISKLFFSK